MSGCAEGRETPVPRGGLRLVARFTLCSPLISFICSREGRSITHSGAQCRRPPPPPLLQNRRTTNLNNSIAVRALAPLRIIPALCSHPREESAEFYAPNLSLAYDIIIYVIIIRPPSLHPTPCKHNTQHELYF